jgi:hypothetical protein
MYKERGKLVYLVITDSDRLRKGGKLGFGDGVSFNVFRLVNPDLSNGLFKLRTFCDWLVSTVFTSMDFCIAPYSSNMNDPFHLCKKSIECIT